MSIVLAQDEDLPLEVQALEGCYEAKDWTCAFDRGAALMEAEGHVASCLADSRHGCAFPVLFLYSTGLAAAADADNAGRRAIAERGLDLVRQMSNGVVDTDGEVFFSALRYDACKSTGDVACVEDSVGMLRLARKSPDYDEENVARFLDDLTQETGVRPPVNVQAIMAEVARTEKLQ